MKKRDPVQDKKTKDIYHSVGLINNLKDEQINDIVNSQYKFVYETIKHMVLEGLTPEEIDEQKRTFVFKYLGKMYTDSEVIRRYKMQDLIIKQKIDARAKKLNDGGSVDNE